MARFRKIDTRMWGDLRFRELSSPGPSGKYLWMFLLTGPHTSNIPGLFRAGEMALSEELGWSVEGFRKGFAELLSKGIAKADWNARVVWIPNAIKYNQPENPNVVKSWRSTWEEIPECALKAEAYERFKAFTKELGEGFLKAFVEGCAKGMANQEQEQEQEQEQCQNPLSELRTSSDVQVIKKPIRHTSKPTHEADALAQLLRTEILRNKPDFRITAGHLRNWAIVADRMIRIDHRSSQQIAALISWVQGDEFWLKNVLSMEKLREKFDQLELKRKADCQMRPARVGVYRPSDAHMLGVSTLPPCPLGECDGSGIRMKSGTRKLFDCRCKAQSKPSPLVGESLDGGNIFERGHTEP